MSDLAKKIAREIFELGDGNNSSITRIQFMSGDWRDDTEKGHGGLCEDALAQCIEATLNQHLAFEKQDLPKYPGDKGFEFIERSDDLIPRGA